MGRPRQRSLEQLIPDQLSAGGSLVIRARPKEDESYLGFLLRLAEINLFDTPYWILKIMGAAASTFRTYSAAASLRLSLRLASLSKLRVKDLGHLYNNPVPGKYLVSFFDHPVPPYLLRAGRPRVCPKCLSQSQYCRKQWDFAAITSCPIHQIMLLEKCPGCRKSITWLRRSVSHCRCGTDWRQTQTARLSKSEIVVSQLIYKEFRLPCTQILNPRDNNPLYDVDLPSLLSALFLITSQQEGRNGDTLAKHIFPGRTSAEIHRGFLAAFAIFDHWPINFHKFLDQLTAARRPKKTASNAREIFGPLYQRLYDPKYLPAVMGDILRKEFENYVLQRWDHGYICSHQWFKLRGGGKYISKTKASAILKLDVSLLDNLVSKGKLRGWIRNSGRRRIFLIEAASVEAFKNERERYLPLKKASKLLGIKQLDVLRVVDNSLLNAARGPSIDNHDTWQFEEATINKFLSTVFSKIVESKPRVGKDLRSLNDVSRSLTITLSSVGWGVQHLVEDILQGVVIPRAEASSKSGLARLLFCKQEIQQYLKTKLTGKLHETFKLETEGRGLPFKPMTLHFLAHKKLIKTRVKTHKGLRCRLITRKAILNFTSKYVAAGSVAREVGTRTEHLIQVLKSYKTYPISGPSIDGGPQYFLRRTDLAPINTEDLQNAVPVSLTRGSVVQLVRNGTLKPYSESGKTRDRYLFNRTYVERLRGQFSDLTNLLSPTVAAEILQLAKTKLYGRWIKTGYLQYETSSDGKMRFLVKSRVDQIADFMNSIVTRAEAAALLSVPWWHIERFEHKGILKQIRNPYPRAYWTTIYSRTDVENLRGSSKEVASYKKKVSKSRLSIRKRNLILSSRQLITQ